MIFRRCLLPLFAGLLFSAALMSADPNAGSITGVITDPKEEPIPAAIVVVTDPKTKQTWEGKANKLGMYKVPDVPPGAYHVTASAEGYRPFSLKDVPIEKGEDTYVDIVMKKR